VIKIRMRPFGPRTEKNDIWAAIQPLGSVHADLSAKHCNTAVHGGKGAI